MRKRDLKVASELKKRLLKVAKLVDLRVFGSRAKGTADDYSDLDIFIEVESLGKKTKEKIIDTVWEVGFENGLVISPLIFTRDEIENTAMRSSNIVKNVEKEGVRI